MLRLRLVVETYLNRFSKTHPPLEERIRALYQPIFADVSAATSLTRAFLVILISIFLSGTTAKAAITVFVAGVDAVAALHASNAESRATPMNEQTADRSAVVWTKVGACTVRESPSMQGEHVGYPKNGICCDLLSDRGKWHQVRCGTIKGWMHGTCLTNSQTTPCVNRR